MGVGNAHESPSPRWVTCVTRGVFQGEAHKTRIVVVAHRDINLGTCSPFAWTSLALIMRNNEPERNLADWVERAVTLAHSPTKGASLFFLLLSPSWCQMTLSHSPLLGGMVDRSGGHRTFVTTGSSKLEENPFWHLKSLGGKFHRGCYLRNGQEV